jgi:hypothetical protein
MVAADFDEEPAVFGAVFWRLDFPTKVLRLDQDDILDITISCHEGVVEAPETVKIR